MVHGNADVPGGGAIDLDLRSRHVALADHLRPIVEQLRLVSIEAAALHSERNGASVAAEMSMPRGEWLRRGEERFYVELLDMTGLAAIGAELTELVDEIVSGDPESEDLAAEAEAFCRAVEGRQIQLEERRIGR